MRNRSRVANGYRIILPILRELAHTRQQHRRSQLGAGSEFAVFLLSRHEQLDMGSPNINGQHFHESNFLVFERGALGADHRQ